MKTEMAQQLRFPWKLHLLLERCASECSEDIISWLPDGKSFRVHDKERFVSEIMPAFFGTQNFKTFQRNLNLWGFTRISKGRNKDVCSHPLFMKGFPGLCQSMKRIVLKGTGRGNRAPMGGLDVSSIKAAVNLAGAAQQQGSAPAASSDSDSQQSLSPQTKARQVALASLPAVPSIKIHKTGSKSSMMMPNVENASSTTTTHSCNSAFAAPPAPVASSNQNMVATTAMLLCNPKTMQQLGALIQNLQFGVESANVSVDTAAAAPAVNLAALVQNYMATAAVTPTPVASSTQDLIQLLLQKKHQQEQQRENTAQLILQHLQNQQWERQTEALKNLTSPSSNPTTMVLLNQLFQQQQRQAVQR